MKKTRMKKIICRFLAVVLLISGLGFECLGAQSFSAHIQEHLNDSIAAENTHSDETFSRRTSVSERQFFLDNNNSEEEMLREAEREERVKERSSLRGLSYSVLSKGFGHNPFSFWNDRIFGLSGGQFETASIIDYIHNLDGKKHIPSFEIQRK